MRASVAFAASAVFLVFHGCQEVYRATKQLLWIRFDILLCLVLTSYSHSLLSLSFKSTDRMGQAVEDLSHKVSYRPHQIPRRNIDSAVLRIHCRQNCQSAKAGRAHDRSFRSLQASGHQDQGTKITNTKIKIAYHR